MTRSTCGLYRTAQRDYTVHCRSSHHDIRLAFHHQQRRLRRARIDIRVRSYNLNYLLQLLNVVHRASSGVYASMLAAPIVMLNNDTEDVGLRVGMFFTIVAMGALAGPPISGAINKATGNYKATGYYAGTQPSCKCTTPVRLTVRLGSCIVISVCLLLITRQFVLGRRLWGKA